MSEDRIDIGLKGVRRTVAVPKDMRDLPLSTLLRRAGVALNTRCGERGLCDGCMVQTTSGSLINSTSGVRVDGRWAGQLRACQHQLDGDAILRLDVPDRSLLEQKPSVVTEFTTPTIDRVDPIWRADADYVGGAWQARVDHRPPPARPLGVAIDIGTTTVVVLLVDLASGAILSRTADFNQQLRLGDDVLTRITRCVDPEGLHELHRAIVEETILPLILTAASLAEVDANDVVCGSIAGNTTMLHLLLGIDPTPLGVVPFTPIFLKHRILRGDLLAPWNRTCDVAPVLHLLPGCSAYVGADLGCGMVATHLLTAPAPSVLIDVGTNGEMILNLGSQTVGCATAAGPAFEGSGLTCGTRAVDGAITHVVITTDPLHMEFLQVGNGRPIGFCGSFYVDFLAQARRAGLLDESGRYTAEAMQRWPHRFTKTQCAGHAMRIANGVAGTELIVSEADIAKLLAAKAAIAAGVQTLLARALLGTDSVHRLFLAGGFGLHIDVPNAIAMGLLPGFTPSQVEVVGNTSLAGAWMCLCSTAALDDTIEAASDVSVIELNQDPGFEDRYIEMLSLPDPV